MPVLVGGTHTVNILLLPLCQVIAKVLLYTDHPLADVHPTEFDKSLFPGQVSDHSILRMYPRKSSDQEAP